MRSGVDQHPGLYRCGKLDAKAVIDTQALIAARVIRRVKDGVRLIGAEGFTASKKVTFKVGGTPPKARCCY